MNVQPGCVCVMLNMVVGGSVLELLAAADHVSGIAIDRERRNRASRSDW